MIRHMPPLNPLRVFECAARHRSFTKAADELYVSQSAVSRQIATLEGYLGVRLFDRNQGGVQLTTVGDLYHQEIGPAFAGIAAATDRLRESTSEAPLKLGIYATFAAKWLMRRLTRFQEQYPEANVRITTIVTPVDFSKDDIDAAVQFGNGHWSGTHAEYLMQDRTEPVCSPTLLEHGPPIEKPADVLGYRLLHSRYRRADWPDWCAKYNVNTEASDIEPMTFPSSLLTYQAAVDGLGVAMGQTRLLTTELESGLLVQPLVAPLERPLAYYLVTPENVPRSRKFKLFRKWLLDEMAEA